MSRRALVTGATGFLGQLVCKALRARGDNVTAITRTDATPHNCDRALPLADVSDRTGLARAVDIAAPEMIFHLAGATTAPSLADLYRVNAAFGATLLDTLVAARSSARMILAGSAAEYGQTIAEHGPVSDSAVCQPVSPYGISKYAQTLHALASAADCVVARPFNPIGPGIRPHLALGAFAAQISRMGVEGGVLKTGDLSAERDFVDAEETAELLLALVDVPAARGRVVNLCSGQPTRLSVIVDAMIKAAGRPIELVSTNPSTSTSQNIPRFIGSPDALRALGLPVPTLDIDRVVRKILAAA